MMSAAPDDFDDVGHLLQCFSSDDPRFHLTSDDFAWIDGCSPAPPPPPVPLLQSQSPESLFVVPIASSSSEGSPISSHVSELEKFLMAEDVQEEHNADVQDSFFADLFAQEHEGSEGSETSTPQTDTGTEALAESERKKKEAPIPIPSEEGVDEGADDPISRKRRRQMRNRDSAMKSRERKKMYIKELEMKSKYLEAECRRLDYALRCCATENLVLHQRLQEKRAFDVSTAKQESAVLFMESLLLGSLFWLVSIICLLLVPSLPNPKWKGISRMGSSLDKGGAAVVKKVGNERKERGLSLQSLIFRKRCRGMRTRIKPCLFALHCCSKFTANSVFGLVW